MTGATEHQVRQTLAEIDASPAISGDTTRNAGLPPAAESRPAADLPEPPPWTGPDAGEPLADDTASDTTSPVNAGEPGGGRFVAWAGFVFGSVVSVAANVLAARIPPPGAPADWRPSIVAQIGAAVWPVALLLAVEVLSRVRWPSGVLWKFARYGGVVGVALGSAAISYGHIHDVLLSWGYSRLGAGVGPLVIDGLMVVAGFALLAMGGGRAGDAGASRRQRTGGPVVKR